VITIERSPCGLAIRDAR